MAPPMTMGKGLAALLVFLGLFSLGCRTKSEEEALQEAREEVRREMQPEIDRRRKEIEALQREIAETKSRIEAQQAERQKKTHR